MGRISDAACAAREASTIPSPPATVDEDMRRYFLHGVLQSRTLRYAGQNKEALDLMADIVENYEDIWTESFDCSFAWAELAILQLECGDTEEALHSARQALAEAEEDRWFEEGDLKSKLHRRMYYLIHAGNTLTACLAAAGEEDEALEQAKWIVDAHIAPGIDLLPFLMIRKEELMANAFHSLSLRLATSGRLEEALSNTQKANELYSDLILLAANHLPSLASGLENIAAILWALGRRGESLAALEEAVSVRRDVSKNAPHFLPGLGNAISQLAGYLLDEGNLEGASTAVSEMDLDPDGDTDYEDLNNGSDTDNEILASRDSPHTIPDPEQNVNSTTITRGDSGEQSIGVVVTGKSSFRILLLRKRLTGASSERRE
jgi:tetratricopeptide (TPR) repeat protein